MYNELATSKGLNDWELFNGNLYLIQNKTWMMIPIWTCKIYNEHDPFGLIYWQTYLWRKVDCLICLSFWNFPNQIIMLFYHPFNIIKKPLVNRGAPSWFNNVLIYDGDGKVIKYWTIFLLKNHLNQH